MKKILIIDDDVAVTNYFKVFLMQTGCFDATVINDSREASPMLKNTVFDVLLLDMDMPNVSGMDILREMRKRKLDTPVVILTGVSDVDLAVRAMKLKAFDYLIKPVDDEKLLEVLSAAMEHGEIRQSISRLPQQLSCGDLTFKDAFRHFPTRNPEMIRLLHQAEKIASTDLSIFIWGESGTGKEAIARAIHSASPRREGPFVAADAGSRDPEKFSSFLFGQAKDWSGSREEAAGLLEQSDHGTLFLNNVDALPVPTQVRLNRVIQTGEFYRENSTQIRKADVRIIVSSSHDLTRPDYKERFSRDLLYHLMINSIQIPPLRDRVEDIPILAEYFMKEEANRIGRKIGGFSPELIDLLSGYSYPDNVQELRTIVVSAVAGADSETIGTEALPMYIRDLFRIEAAGGEGVAGIEKLDAVIERHVAQTFEYFGKQKEKTAEALGIPVEEVERLAGGSGDEADETSEGGGEEDDPRR